MNIVHALLGEHGPLRHQLDVLRLNAPQLDGGQLRAATLGFAEALESHAHLEDELLFEPLATSNRMPPGPVEVMRAEHQQIEDLLDRLLAATEDPQRTLARLVETVRHHFDHEEQVLFPMAVNLLAEERLAELAAVWADRRQVGIRLSGDREPAVMRAPR